MVRRYMKPILLGTALAFLLACAPKSNHDIRTPRDLTVSDQAFPGINGNASPNNANPAAVGATVAGPAPAPQVNSLTPLDAAPAPRTSTHTETPPSGTPSLTPIKANVHAFFIPEKVKEKVAEKFPDLVVPQTNAFTVPDPSFIINQKDSTMTFSGTLTVGSKSEPIELQCHFDPSQMPWSCDDMFPTDLNIANQRRLQATATCQGFNYDKANETYACDAMSLQLYVEINDKTETQLFQSHAFEITRYRGEENLDDQIQPDEPATATNPPVTKPPPTPKEPKGPDVVEQKPTPKTPENPPPAPPQEPAPSDDEAEETEPPLILDDPGSVAQLDDPQQVFQMVDPIAAPRPSVGKFSPKGIKEIPTDVSDDVPIQAVGDHNHGHLVNATSLPESGKGFMCRPNEKNHYGTKLMVDLIESVAAIDKRDHPSSSGPIVIADISAQHGGRLAKHASHVIGLDADIVFPSTEARKNMFDACDKHSTKEGTVCVSGSRIRDIDDARMWQMLQEFTCAKNEPVLGMFLDNEIKKHFCQYARKVGADVDNPSSCASRTLRALRHWPGHYNHVHVRLRCPTRKGPCNNVRVSETKCPT